MTHLDLLVRPFGGLHDREDPPPRNQAGQARDPELRFCNSGNLAFLVTRQLRRPHVLLGNKSRAVHYLIVPIDVSWSYFTKTAMMK